MGNKKATGFLCLRLVPCFAYVGAEDNRKGIPFVKIVSLLCKLIQFLMVALSVTVHKALILLVFLNHPYQSLAFAEFLEASRHAGHKVLLLSCYSGDALCARIAADETKKTVCVENLSADCLKLPFGNNKNPIWKDYQHFLEDRCIPKTRAGLQEYLEAIGVDSYEPLEIIRKTQGRMAGDDLWLTMEEIK